MTIKSLENFQKFVGGFSANEKWIFRGQYSSKWFLRPQAGRPRYSVITKTAGQPGNELSADFERFEEWRKLAKEVFHDLPNNDFECLAFAQHYGLVTRLLDWTKDPLVALYFAVQHKKTQKPTDGVVFAHKTKFLIKQKFAQFSTPELGYDFCVLEPEVLNPRVIAQKGLFTYHKNPWADMRQAAQNDVLKYVVIAHGRKKQISEQLRETGYSKQTMFPDIETISKKVNRETRRMAKKLQRIEETTFRIPWKDDA